MADIKDFLKTDFENQIKNSFEQNRHIEWISFRYILLDLFLKAFLYISLKTENKDKSNIDYINRLTFGNTIRIASLSGLIDTELRKKLYKFSEWRNLVIHNLIMKNEKIEKINLKEFFELGKLCTDKLSRKMIIYIPNKMILDSIIEELYHKK